MSNNIKTEFYNNLIKSLNNLENIESLRSFGLETDHELAYIWQTFFNLEKIDEEEEIEQRLWNSKPNGNKLAETANNKGKSDVAVRSAISHDGPDVRYDEQLEQADPTPDIDVLLKDLNKEYFRGKLPPVFIRWSNRLTYTAGYTKFDGKTACIVLSAPLLSLRPRKDLISTLLHEMIHAFLFYKGKFDHIDHGPSFIRWMKRLNGRAGTNIAPYHSYYEEVDFLRRHWWRCDGPCTLQAPYFGLVRRTVDRAPSRQDRWWARHARTCGGTFSKVKSPDSAGAPEQTWTRRLLKRRVPRVRFKRTMRVYTIPARRTRQRERSRRRRGRRVNR